MQSLWGKVRFLTRQRVSCLKHIDFRSITNPESKFIDHASRSSSERLFSSWSKNLSMSAASSASFRSDVMALGAFSYRGLCSYLPRSAAMSSFPHRCMTTTSSPGEGASAASDVPQRVKFKRLDKTARHIMQILDKEAVEEVKAQREIPEIKPGYIVQLKVEVPENKRRVSSLKGIVIARRNAGIGTTIRIRRLIGGVAVESLFPLYSPNIKEIKVLDKKKVRRAKLYYLRDRMNPLKDK